MQVQSRILKFLQERVAPLEDPHAIGETLTGGLKRLWKYLAGPYRLICDIQAQRVRVMVVRIGHRREVYR